MFLQGFQAREKTDAVFECLETLTKHSDEKRSTSFNLVPRAFSLAGKGPGNEVARV